MSLSSPLPIVFSTKGDASSLGFSLLSSLIAVIMLGIVSMSFVSMMVVQNRAAQEIKKKLVEINLKSSILKTMSQEDRCGCHFDPGVNKSIPSGETLTLNTNTYEDINLGSIRAGCDFDSTENIIASSGSEVPSIEGLMVDEVKVSDIKPTGMEGQYYGNLIVEYKYNSVAGDLSVRPLSIPLVLNVDLNSGDPSSRPIRSCWQGGEESHLVGVDCYDVSDSGSNPNKSLIACGRSVEGTRNQAILGFQAGALTTFETTTYLGYQAGLNHKSHLGVLIGAFSGKDSTGYVDTFVGYKAGLATEGEYNLFMGYMAGASPLLTGLGASHNVLIGSESGVRSRVSEMTAMGYRSVAEGRGSSIVMGAFAGEFLNNASRSILLGFEAGQRLRGGLNIFIGDASGRKAKAVHSNVFVGQRAGEMADGAINNVSLGFDSGLVLQGENNVFAGAHSGKVTEGGANNTFIGHNSGRSNKSDQNLFVGSQSGYNHKLMEDNTFIGWRSGYNHTEGKRNILLGTQAGEQLGSGDNNIFIGRRAGDLPEYSVSQDKFVVGVESHRNWLTGDIKSTGNLYVNGQQVALTSSRSLKKNIKLVKDVEGYLQDLLKTPLFTYHYKSESDIPDKQRMGVISEDLPMHLQIQKKGRLSHPDWPSIYGSFWAGIKALYEPLMKLEEEIQSQLQSLKAHFDRLKQSQNQLMKSIQIFKEDMLGMGNELQEIHLKLEETEKELVALEEEVDGFSKKISFVDIER